MSYWVRIFFSNQYLQKCRYPRGSHCGYNISKDLKTIIYFSCLQKLLKNPRRSQRGNMIINFSGILNVRIFGLSLDRHSDEKKLLAPGSSNQYTCFEWKQVKTSNSCLTFYFFQHVPPQIWSMETRRLEPVIISSRGCGWSPRCFHF